MSLMSDNGDIREDLRVPENEVGKEIESKFEAGDEFMVSGEARVLLLKSIGGRKTLDGCVSELGAFWTVF